MLIPIQAASLFGSYFITAIIVGINTLLAFALMKSTKADKCRKYALAALIVFTSNMALGGILYASHKSQAKGGDTVRVGVIQGNYDSTDKWFEPNDYVIVSDHLKLTEAAAKDGAEIVLWAETALPFTLYDDDPDSEMIAQTAAELNVTIIVGAIREDDGNIYNTLFCFTPNGKVSETKYYKRRLVPFGEYVPMRDFMENTLPFMAEIAVLTEDMTPGDDGTVFNLENANAGSLICFDSIYENLTRDTVKNGADLILLSTNDSWFSNSSAIYMHNNQARFRAVECGRYIARSANTGLSSFISNTGEVIDNIEPFAKESLCADLTTLNTRTLYSRIGNIFVYMCGISILVPFVYDLINRLKSKQKFAKGDQNEIK